MAVSLNSNALITAEELQIILNTNSITSSVTGIADTSYRNTLINMASDFIQTFCNRVLIYTAYTREAYCGTGKRYLYLDKFPVDTNQTFTLEQWDIYTNTLVYTYTENTDFIISRSDIGELFKATRFMAGVNNYRITYTAGYTIDGADSTTIVPYDLKMACAKLAGMLFYNRGKSGISGETIGSYSINYANPSASFMGIPVPDDIAGVLNIYRRVNI